MNNFQSNAFYEYFAFNSNGFIEFSSGICHQEVIAEKCFIHQLMECVRSFVAQPDGLISIPSET